MSRIREDYEKTTWRRLVHFINGDESDMTEEAGYEVETEATAQRIHDEYSEEVEWKLKKEKAGVKSEGYLYVYQNGALLSIKRLSCDSYAPVRGIIGKKI